MVLLLHGAIVLSHLNMSNYAVYTTQICTEGNTISSNLLPPINGKLYINLISKGAPNTIGTTSEASAITASNLGTSFKYIGMYAAVKMDGYTTIRIVADVQNGSGQVGTITVEIFDITQGTSLVSFTFASDVRNVYDNTASISLTGIHTLVARIKSSNTTDDPKFHSIGCILE